MTVRATPKKRRVNDPEALRGRLLDVAAELFQGRGYNATTMHDIVRAARTTGERPPGRP
jgi:AcrR family transcriptional regulator